MVHPLVLIFTGYWLFAIAFRPVMQGARLPDRQALLAGLVLTVLTATFMHAVLPPEIDGQINMNPQAPNWSAIGFFCYGLGCIAVAGLEFRKHVTIAPGVMGSVRFGTRLWTVIGGAYLVVASCMHWAFWRDQDHAGVMNVDMMSGVRDVPCHGMVPVIASPDWIEYHCPRGVVYEPYSFEPFLPWPDYSVGRSVQLLHAYQDVSSSAKRF